MKLPSLIKLFASIALIAIVLWAIGPARVFASFAGADARWLAAGFAASMTASLFSALRWHALAAWLGIHAPRRDMILAYWRGVMANTVLPGAILGGDALRALHLQQLGHHIANAALSVLLDRLSGLWILLALSLSMTAVAQGDGLLHWSPPLLGTRPGLIAGFALLVLIAPLPVWRLSSGIAARLPAKAARLLEALHARPRPLRQYLAQIFWSGSVQIFSIAAFVCGGRAVGLDLPWWQFVIAAGPVFILAALPVGIGGWGTREAAAALVLGAFGAARETAVACAILYGLFATLQGLLGALSFMHTKGKSNAG